MVFRAERETEFMEAYSSDHTVYAVFRSQRKKGELPWTCSTTDTQTFSEIKQELPVTNIIESSAGQLKTMRLAQSCTAEYSNYFGATSSAQVSLVLAAIQCNIDPL
jgi:alpha-acetolactate decarboxylase